MKFGAIEVAFFTSARASWIFPAWSRANASWYRAGAYLALGRYYLAEKLGHAALDALKVAHEMLLQVWPRGDVRPALCGGRAKPGVDRQ